MSAIGDALADLNSVNRSFCTVALYMAKLDAEDQAALRAALAAHPSEVGHSALHRSLSAPTVVKLYGKPPPDFTIGKHRRRTCSCEPDADAA